MVLEGTSTETGAQVAPRVEVAGPSDQTRRLVEDLGRRLIQEFPQVRGHVVSEATFDPNAPKTYKETAAFIAVSDQDPAPRDLYDLIGRLGASPPIQNRFTIVDRALLDKLASEQELSGAIADRSRKLVPGKVLPAAVVLAVRRKQTADTLEISVTGINTKTGQPACAAITVSGPASTVDALVDELGRRIAEEAPRQTHETPDDASATVTCDLGARKGVREYLKCLLYRMEEVVDPHSHEKLGERPVVLGEGFMTRVREQASVAAVFPRSEGSDMGKIEAGTYVVLK